VLHEEFFESEIKQVHLYICGVGNVGSKLIQQIYSQNKYLNDNLLMNLRVAGLTNSTKMVFNDKGIKEDYKDASKWRSFYSANLQKLLIEI
jgi:aspartokinase/homoserine dehydrogenase 1